MIYFCFFIDFNASLSAIYEKGGEGELSKIVSESKIWNIPDPRDLSP
jgi:hypothetical protein